MAVKCAGTARGASPTVILLPGLTAPLTAFASIQNRLSSVTRVCSYDRPGEGASPQPKRKQTLVDSARLLHDLLSALHLSSHGIILVGHSVGGTIAAEYASQYRRDHQVRAVVLLDATPVGFGSEVQKLIAPGTGGISGETRSANADISSGDNPERLVLRPLRIAPIGNVPLTVVRHGLPIFDAVPNYAKRLEAIWVEGERMWLRLSTKSRMVIARHSGHDVYLDQPSLTVALIREAISQAR